MALIDISFNNISGSEIRYYESHNIDVSLIGNKNDDEKKKNTLQNDVVTLTGKTEDSSTNKYSSNHSKALKAYLGFSKNQSTSDAAKSVEQNLSPTSSNKEQSETSEAIKDPLSKEDNKDKSSDSVKEDDKSESKNNDKKPNGEELTDEEQAKVTQMKERDTEVKTHEKAHQSAGGQYASAPSYETEKGPDGKSYVTDGHVNISISKEKTADATIKKMQQVIKAANAPAQPSGQDLKVAAQAQQTLNEAQAEKAKEASSNSSDNKKSDSSNSSTDSKDETKNTSSQTNDAQTSSKIAQKPQLSF